MFHFFNSRIRTLYAATCSILVLLLLASPIALVYAEDMPDHDQLSIQITNQALDEINNPEPQPASTEAVNTGDDAEILQKDNSETNTTVENNNTAVVNQTVNAEANTGNNEASRNISFGGNAGVINTGDAVVNTTSVVSANNSNTTVGSGSGSGGSGSASITNTGDNFDSDSGSSSKTTTLVNNNNTVVINQVTNASANTGGNVADRNISFGGSAGVITTGNASVNTSYMVIANNNRTVALVGGVGGNGPGSGASIHILNTGNRFNYYGMSRYSQNALVNNNNQASINQTANVSANTGGNSSDRGISYGGDAGVINTGNAIVNVSLMALANKNTNLLSLGGIGGGIGGLQLLNTGDDTDISQENSSKTNVGVNNQNTATVNQSVSVYANTGNNTANRNISFGGNAGVINTGDAVISACLVADVNSSDTTISLVGADQESWSNPTPSATPMPASTPAPTPSATPHPYYGGIGGHNNSDTTSNNGTAEYDYTNYYYPSSSSSTTSDPIGKTLSDLVNAITTPGQVLASTTEACPPCSATAVTSESTMPELQKVLKGLMLLSLGYGLSVARNKLPRFVGNK